MGISPNVFRLVAVGLLAAAVVSALDDPGCSASFDGRELVIRNTRVERRWRVAGDSLQATSLRDVRTKREWIAATVAPEQSAPARFDFTQTWETVVPQEKSLIVELKRKETGKPGFRFRVFANASAISMQPVELDRTKGLGNGPENFVPNADHLRLTQVELFDQTDVHNELVQEKHWLLHPSESIRLQGNLFTMEDTLTGGGLIFLKEAPLPHARPEKAVSDFEFDGAKKQIRLPNEGMGSNGRGYWLTTLVYTGGRPGITKALGEYQRQMRPYRAGRDGMFLSNTWGDRSRDARINDSFMRQEITAGARLGVDVIQIDDGWQQGRTKNSAQATGGVWNGFWAADPGFWNFNRERFPNGLEPLSALARREGMGFGLWFAPDSSNDFANWERDAARLLEIHRQLGVTYFKIDGVKATSKLSEERLGLLFARILAESQGKITFDLDVTAEIRPGYFGAMSVGPLFVENRYTDRPNYWPHQTLRNFWSLAQYVDPLRLRVEFLNQARNTSLYAGDALAPSEYSPAYLFATTMMANPLGWFETSRLPERYFTEVGPLVKRWKQERVRMQSGQIYPIGDQPDGVAWTGFVSVADGSRDGYLLVFRERNSSERWSVPLPQVAVDFSGLTLLGGKGSASVKSGRLDVTIPTELGFAWFRVGGE